jgi:mannan endo-1,4-beta-mannosidase
MLELFHFATAISLPRNLARQLTIFGALLIWINFPLNTLAKPPGSDDSAPPFITRQGDRLLEGTNEFRFFGLDAPNLHQNESQLQPDFSNRFPDEFEITDTLESLRQLGSRATRCFSLSFRGPESNGAPVYIEGPGRYNEQAFRTLDKVFQIADEKNVRIILPVIASQSFGGWRGVDEFAAFRGQPGTNFWTDPQLRTDFRRLLFDLLNRTNTFTGIQYKNDPAILAWQLGNELDSYYWDRGLDRQLWLPRITQWSVEMAAYIKSVDTNHLVMDGGGDRKVYLTDPNVDIISEHLYEYWREKSGQPTNLAAAARDVWSEAAGYKPVIIDEFGMDGERNLEALMDAIKESGISGGLLWSIRSHRRDGGFYYHNEAGTRWNSYHWPGFSAGESYDEIPLLMSVRRNAYAIRRLSPPPLPAPTDAPVLFPVQPPGKLRWRGCTGASGYDIARALEPDGPWTVIAKNVPDVVITNVIAFENSQGNGPRDFYGDDASLPNQNYYYRLRGRNNLGVTAWSNVQKLSHP